MREQRPGYWQFRVLEGKDPMTGKVVYRTRGFRGTKGKAQRALAALVTEVDRGRVAPTAVSVRELLDAWLAHIEGLGRSPSTLDGYRRLVAALPAGFVALPLKKVAPKVVDDLYRWLAKETGRKAATVVHFHAMLRAAFNQAMRWGWVESNPVARASAPSVHRPQVHPPAVADVARVLVAAARSRNPENAMIFRVLAATGCRRGEVCGLQWADVDLDPPTATVTFRRAIIEVGGQQYVKDTKAHAERTVGLDEATTTALSAHRDEAAALAAVAGGSLSADDYVFPYEPGSPLPLPPDRISQAWMRLCKDQGVAARLHDLRHLQASLLLDAGESVTTVAARLGHRDTSTTLKVYAHLMPGADQRAARLVGTALDVPVAVPADAVTGLSIPEAAHRLGVKEYLVRVLISDGRLAATKTHGRWLIDPESVAQYLDRERQAS